MTVMLYDEKGIMLLEKVTGSKCSFPIHLGVLI